jgi:hypothetical protein
MTKGYTAFKLSEASRQQILSAFPPQFPETVCDHITINFGVDEDAPLPEGEPHIEIIGHAINKDGIEALVVSVNGETLRDDGKAYHITLSLDPNKNAPAEYDIMKPEDKRKERPFKPVHSNALIAVDGYDPVAVDLDIEATAQFIALPGQQSSPAVPRQEEPPKYSNG